MRQRLLFVSRLASYLAGLLLFGCQNDPMDPVDGAGVDLPTAPDSGPLKALEIYSVSPSKTATTGGDVLTIKGSGFTRGMTIKIADRTVEPMSWEGNGEARVMAPVLLGQSGKVEVKVQNSDGQVARRGDLLTYVRGLLRFFPSMDTQGGYGSNAVQIADVNGDGKPDLVMAYMDQGVMDRSSAISVFLGNGNGGFTFSKDYDTGPGLFSMVLADVNMDHRPDLVAINSVQNTMQVYLGKGDGTFKDRVSYATEDRPVAVALADVNSDGVSDAVTANGDSSTLCVFIGSPDGTFAPCQSVKLDRGPRTMALGDVNGDKIPDVVLTEQGKAEIDVLLGGKDGGKGNGTFTLFGTYPLSSAASGVALADLNGDGYADLLASNRDKSTMTVLLGKGNGTFVLRGAPYVGDGPESLVVTDLNLDGRPDVVLPCFAQGRVSVLMGIGNGDFQPAVFYKTADAPYILGVGDVNGDQLPDIIGGNRGGSYSVLLNTSM